MNVFVLNTGRCGSTTFIKACSHIKNYSSSHESRVHLLGQARLSYPQNHIEADNRLSWLLGRLHNSYGNNAMYIHLTREKNATARSFARRVNHGIMRAYANEIVVNDSVENDPMSLALDYCDTVNQNIEYFLKDKDRTLLLSLENIQEDFEKFWNFIGAEGDLDAALSEWKVSYNASQTDSSSNLIKRLVNKLRRILYKLPDFIKSS